MKKILSLFVLLLAFGARAQTSSNQVYIVVTTTNIFGSTNLADSITINGSTRRMTNDISSSPSTLIRGTNSINKASTNTYQHFKLYPPPGSGLDIIPTGTNTFIIQARYGDSITFSSAGKWGTITLKTNPTTYGVGLRMPIDTYAPTNRTNYASMMARALDLSTSRVSGESPAFTNFVNAYAPQEVSNKNFYGGSLTQVNLKVLNLNTGHVDMTYNIATGSTPYDQATGYRFYDGSTNIFTMLTWNGEDPYIFYTMGTNTAGTITVGGPVDISPLIGISSTVGGNFLLNVYSATKIFPLKNSLSLGYTAQFTNDWATINNWDNSSNRFLQITHFNGINATGAVSTITNVNGAFIGLTATNLQGLGGYLTGIFGNALTLSNAPVVHALNLQALSGFSSNFFNSFSTLSNAISINGTNGLLYNGSWSNATLVGASVSNSIVMGTNVNAGDISYPWYELNTIANGVNPAIPVGTNVNIRLSGNSLPATIIGIAGWRSGRELYFVNGSGAAITFSQSTSDPVVANRIVGNITDVTIQPGESIHFSWIAADGKWRFFVPTSVSGHYTLYSQSTSGAATNITLVETSILGNGSGSKTLPSGYWESNKMVNFFFDGTLWTGATPGKSYLAVKLGSTVVCSNLFTPTANLVGKPIFIRGTITCRTNSATGALLASGYIMTPNANTYEAFTNLLTVIDTTAAMAFDLTATNGATTTSIGTDNGGLEKK